MKTSFPRQCFFLLGGLFCVLLSSSSWGQTATWNGTGIGNWTDTAKWTWSGGAAPASGLPESANTAVIGNSHTVQFIDTAATITALTMNNGRFEMTRNSGTSILTVSNAVTLGNTAGTHSVMVLDGLGTELIKGATGQFHVGSNGSATLTVQNQAKVTSGNGFHVGLGSATASTMNVTTGGQVIVNSTFMIGHRGNGIVNVTEGGYLKTSNGYLSGYGQDSNRSRGTSLLKVSGLNSKWDVGLVYVGNAGSGTILVEDQGQVISTNSVYIGYFNAGGTTQPFPAPSYGTGVLTVQTNGLFKAASGLHIGTAGGTGTLNVASGGRVEVNNGTGTSNGVGTITVGGLGSINIGANPLLPEAVPTAPGILSAATLTSAEAGRLVTFFHTDNTGTYHLTKTGLSGGAHVAIAGQLGVKALAGTTTLTAANTFSGGTEIGGDVDHSARLIIAHAAALGTGGVVIKDNGVLEIAAGVTTTLTGMTLEGGSGLAITLNPDGGDTTPAIQLSQSLSLADDSEEKIKIYVSGADAITNPELYDWTLLTATAGIDAEDTSRFELVSDTPGLYLFLRDNSLVLGMTTVMIPEPGRAGLCLLALGVVALRRRRCETV